MRWKFYHAKKRNFQGEDPEFVKKPWYQNSEYSPPPASVSVEAYMEICLKDMMDPAQRKQIHDNLKPEERDALKDFRLNFAAKNLRHDLKTRYLDLLLLMEQLRMS